MQQNLSVKLTIPIPSDSILIKKVELEELKQAQLLNTKTYLDLIHQIE